MKIGVVGATGRMGKEVISLLSSGEISGKISGETPKNEWKFIISNSDCVIDFSSPAGSLETAALCKECKVPLVCGTTGFSAEEMIKLQKYSNDVAILHAGNFSIGISVVSQLMQLCEKVLNDFDIAIVDRHHNKKKDQPSGTAKFLAEHLTKSPQVVSLRIGGVVGDHICSFSGENEEITISHRAFNRKVFAEGAIKCARWLHLKPAGFYSMKDYICGQK